MSELDEGLLSRVAKRLDEPTKFAAPGEDQSILELAATAYSAGLSSEEDEDLTRPTGFNPHVAALFEAVIESAFLVAHADGVFDEDEVRAFKKVVIAVCHGKVTEAQVEALLADFSDQLDEDGLDKRLEMVGRTITRPEHAFEVLRIAGLLAAVSAGVSDEERAVLERMAQAFGVRRDLLQQALDEVDAVLSA